jgi:hypothetical protein
MAVDNLGDLDSHWAHASSIELTLKKKIEDMGAMHNSDRIYTSDRINILEQSTINLSTSVQLLQLHAMEKITTIEMGNLMRMLNSVDPENHVVANETIKELLKTI